LAPVVVLRWRAPACSLPYLRALASACRSAGTWSRQGPAVVWPRRRSRLSTVQSGAHAGDSSGAIPDADPLLGWCTPKMPQNAAPSSKPAKPPMIVPATDTRRPWRLRTAMRLSPPDRRCNGAPPTMLDLAIPALPKVLQKRFSLGPTHAPGKHRAPAPTASTALIHNEERRERWAIPSAPAHRRAGEESHRDDRQHRP
jgi:hypothetical protein